MNKESKYKVLGTIGSIILIFLYIEEVIISYSNLEMEYLFTKIVALLGEIIFTGLIYLPAIIALIYFCWKKSDKSKEEIKSNE
jgi:hypothetical protein